MATYGSCLYYCSHMEVWVGFWEGGVLQSTTDAGDLGIGSGGYFSTFLFLIPFGMWVHGACPMYLCGALPYFGRATAFYQRFGVVNLSRGLNSDFRRCMFYLGSSIALFGYLMLILFEELCL